MLSAEIVRLSSGRLLEKNLTYKEVKTEIQWSPINAKLIGLKLVISWKSNPLKK